MLLAAGMGLVRAFPAKAGLVHDLVPLDTVVDATLAAALCTVDLRGEGDDIPVVHACSSGIVAQPLRAETLCSAGERYFAAHPPTPHLRKCKNVHPASVWEFEREQAQLHQRAFVLEPPFFARKQGVAMSKAMRLAQKAEGLFHRITYHEWIFRQSNMQRLDTLLSACGELVDGYGGLRIENLNYDDYIELYCYGLCRYVLKEEGACAPLRVGPTAASHAAVV